jgi:aldose 1-epimerase
MVKQKVIRSNQIKKIMNKLVAGAGTTCVLIALGTGLLTSCATEKSSGMKQGVSPIVGQSFGVDQDGTPVEIYTLRNAQGMTARIMTYGGIVQSLMVPDKSGSFGDVVLGYDTLDGYLTNSPYFGALIGRYGNRIAKGHFTLDGHTYTLATNNGPNSLHGGLKGFDKRVWKVMRAENTPQGPQLELAYTSRDGEEGFPGTLKVTALYTITPEDGLRLDYTATTDKDTIVNLTQHSYFNLAGHGTILDHVVQINADKFTPVDSTLITTGELRPVAGTPFDFRKPATVGSRVNAKDEQIKFGGGIDHNWVVNHAMGELGLDATVTDPASGRVMQVWSTEPGLQFYCGNFLDGTIHGKGGKIYPYRGAIVVEPQHYPDSPNHPEFPTTELKPGETYHNTIIYKFSKE